MLKLKKNKLYQWDTNVKLLIDESIEKVDEVHFNARYSKEVLCVKVYRTDTETYVYIPNILLQQTYDILAYTYRDDENSNHTNYDTVFTITPRPKPSEYVYTETEVFTYKSLENRIIELEKNRSEEPGESAVVDSELSIESENPVQNKVIAQKFNELSQEIDDLKGGNYSSIEPMEDDIPKVFIDGTIPTTKDDVLAEMTYISKTEKFHAYLEIKCQGSSSMQYPKKNFTIKMYSDESRETKLEKTFRNWGIASNKYVLKADYLDSSHLRNVIGARLWGEVVSSRNDYDSLPTELKTSPNNGAIDGFPVKVYTNGNYYGVYMFNIGKDDWMWGMDKDNKNHVLLCAETNTGDVYGETPCNFRALWNGVDKKDWSVEVGENSDAVKNRLNALITCVKDTDDVTFKATLGNYLDVQSAIDYYIHQYVICGIDNLAKNMLLGTYDLQKWYMGAYDMDRAFGIKWEDGFSSADAQCPEDYREKYNLLFERLEQVFTSEMIARYWELRKSVYTYSNMISKMENLYYTIGTELYGEEYEIWTEMYFKGKLTIQHMRQFIHDRLVYVDGEFPNIGYKIECEGITLDRNEVTISEPTELLVAVTPSNTTDVINWESSDDSIAIVNNGIVTPKGIGECVITVTCGNYSAECNVTVEVISLASQITWKDGFSIDASTGKEFSDAESSVTDYINLCGANHVAYIDASSVNGSFKTSSDFFDADKKILGRKGSFTLINSDSSVKENSKYMRITSKTANKGVFDILSDVDTNGYIKLDSSKFVSNKVPTSGVDEDKSGFGYFDEYIPVSEGNVVIFANLTHFFGEEPEGVSYNSRYVLYDSNKQFVNNIYKAEKTLACVTIPSGISYIKFVSHVGTKDYRYYKILN